MISSTYYKHLENISLPINGTRCNFLKSAAVTSCNSVIKKSLRTKKKCRFMMYSIQRSTLIRNRNMLSIVLNNVESNSASPDECVLMRDPFYIIRKFVFGNPCQVATSSHLTFLVSDINSTLSYRQYTNNVR